MNWYGPLLPFVFLVTVPAQLSPQQPASRQEPTDATEKTPSAFIRFVREGEGGHLDTAITTYRKGDVEVILFAAVHIADQACYQALNERFTDRDALLYELVGPEDYRPSRDQDSGFNPLSLLQAGLKNSLELSFQLDAIDYSPKNFVHADMTPQEFRASMKERGESLLGVMWRMMVQGTKQQDGGAAQEPAGPDLVRAFRAGEGRHALRMTLASQLEGMEAIVAGDGEKGSTLIEGRNEKCLEVLQRELAAGKQKLGVYYGAAHLSHLERRLVGDLGFRKVDHQWLRAWDCRKRPDKRFDRAVAAQRRVCKEQLEALAQVAGEYRDVMAPEAPPSIAELAKTLRDGAPWYQGPMQDPWGHDFVLRKCRAGAKWEAASFGDDGVSDTDDDLVVQETRSARTRRDRLRRFLGGALLDAPDRTDFAETEDYRKVIAHLVGKARPVGVADGSVPFDRALALRDPEALRGELVVVKGLIAGPGGMWAVKLDAPVARLTDVWRVLIVDADGDHAVYVDLLERPEPMELGRDFVEVECLFYRIVSYEAKGGPREVPYLVGRSVKVVRK